ncbi:uncharacterized protein skl [Eurosta solidaginis]|uniref:uncharacterized protein skl n=1 Tax=Eurosta solidaginis TaxID=178769 RepID=UPI003530921C
MYFKKRKKNIYIYNCTNMAIPFYEPRQQQHTNDCDQIDGNFPPAPSSQSMTVPTANSNMTLAIITPTTGSVTVPRASVSASAAFVAPQTTSTISATSSATIAANTATTLNTTPSISAFNATAGTATFSFASNNEAAANATASLATQTNSTAFETSTSSNLAPNSTADTLPWKLLAVSMCKALKQYYEQNDSNSILTTAVIEILPSGVSAARE